MLALGVSLSASCGLQSKLERLPGGTSFGWCAAVPPAALGTGNGGICLLESYIQLQCPYLSQTFPIIYLSGARPLPNQNVSGSLIAVSRVLWQLTLGAA